MVINNYSNILVGNNGFCICLLETDHNSISNSEFRKLLAEPLKLGSYTLLLG